MIDEATADPATERRRASRGTRIGAAIAVIALCALSYALTLGGHPTSSTIARPMSSAHPAAAPSSGGGVLDGQPVPLSSASPAHSSSPTPSISPIDPPTLTEPPTRPVTSTKPPAQPKPTTTSKPKPTKTPTGPIGEITGLSGLCVDVTGGKPSDGARIQVANCAQSAGEIWTVASDGTYRTLGKCLTRAASTGDGSAVTLSTCTGSAAQQWIFSTGRDIVNPAANRCLDVADATGGTATAGTPLEIWTCTGDANQKWSIP
jgi:ricin-type beta-trefoil lectin protein